MSFARFFVLAIVPQDPFVWNTTAIHACLLLLLLVLEKCVQFSDDTLPHATVSVLRSCQEHVFFFS